MNIRSATRITDFRSRTVPCPSPLRHDDCRDRGGEQASIRDPKSPGLYLERLPAHAPQPLHKPRVIWEQSGIRGNGLAVSSLVRSPTPGRPEGSQENGPWFWRDPLEPDVMSPPNGSGDRPSPCNKDGFHSYRVCWLEGVSTGRETHYHDAQAFPNHSTGRMIVLPMRRFAR